MPGNLLAASPSGVFPQTLSLSFKEDRSYPLLSNYYHDGSPERGLITDGVNVPVSLRSWTMAKRLKSSDLVTLRNFYEQQSGGLIPFYFYCPFENLPGTRIGSNYDPNGVSITGRHVVVFSGDWIETTDIARTNTNFALLEIA